MSTIHIEGLAIKPSYELPKNIYGIMQKLSKSLPVASLFSLFYLKEIREKVWNLYQEAISDEQLGEEAFFDLMEIVFLNSLYYLKAQRKKNLLYRIFIGKPGSKASEKALEWSAILIAPKEFDKELREELKAVAREALQTFLVRERLEQNEEIKKNIFLRLEELKRKNDVNS